MAWITANWFWIFIGVAFIALHMFGHGGHGGSGRNPDVNQNENDAPPKPAAMRAKAVIAIESPNLMHPALTHNRGPRLTRSKDNAEYQPVSWSLGIFFRYHFPSILQPPVDLRTSCMGVRGSVASAKLQFPAAQANEPLNEQES